MRLLQGNEEPPNGRVLVGSEGLILRVYGL